MVGALGFQLPLERSVLVQAAALACSLILVPRRCVSAAACGLTRGLQSQLLCDAVRCDLVLCPASLPCCNGRVRLPPSTHTHTHRPRAPAPHWQVYECEEAGATPFYNRLVARLSMAAAKVLPLGVASRHDVRFRQPTPVTPCILVHSWAQATVGFLLPALILRWSRSCRPRRVARLYGGRPCTLLLRPQPAVLLVHYLALFFAAAAVGWSGLELALRAWQQVWGGALSSQRPPGTLPGG